MLFFYDVSYLFETFSYYFHIIVILYSYYFHHQYEAHIKYQHLLKDAESNLDLLKSIDPTRMRSNRFGPKDWLHNVNLKDGTLVSRVQLLLNNYCTLPNLPKNSPMEEIGIRDMINTELWNNCYNDMNDVLELDSDTLQSATIICVCHLGSTIASTIDQKYTIQNTIVQENNASNEEDDEEEHRRLIMEEDTDYELLDKILQRSLHLVSTDISLRTRNRVESSINGITKMALSGKQINYKLKK